MDPKLRMYLAELVGTFVLVFVGAGAVCSTFLTTEPRLGVTAAALAEGCTLAVVLSATFLVSTGCLNPAITLVLWVFKRLDTVSAFVLILMQLVGASLAGLALRGLFAFDVAADSHLGAPYLRALQATEGAGRMESLVSGTGVELVLTFLLTLAVFASLIDRRGPRLGGLVVGLAQVAVILVGFRLTGGAANPARWFGPALWQLTLPNQSAAVLGDWPVYWFGPLLGALLGGFFYSAVIVPPEK